MIRPLTAADLDTPFLATLQAARPGVDRNSAGGMFQQHPDGRPFIVIGDPVARTLCRLEHYQRPADYPILAGQMAPEISDLIGPVSLRDPGGPQFFLTVLLLLLAEGLNRMVEQFPVTGPRPAWGFGFKRLTDGLKLAFPMAVTLAADLQGAENYIYVPSLSAAALAVRGIRADGV